MVFLRKKSGFMPIYLPSCYKASAGSEKLTVVLIQACNMTLGSKEKGRKTKLRFKRNNLMKINRGPP